MEVVTSTPAQDAAVEREEQLSCRFPPSPVLRRGIMRVTVVTAYVGRHAELPTQLDLTLVSVDATGHRRVVDRSKLVRDVPIRARSGYFIAAAWVIHFGAAVTLLGSLRTGSYPLFVLGVALAWFAGYCTNDINARRHLPPPP